MEVYNKLSNISSSELINRIRLDRVNINDKLERFDKNQQTLKASSDDDSLSISSDNSNVDSDKSNTIEKAKSVFRDIYESSYDRIKSQLTFPSDLDNNSNNVYNSTANKVIEYGITGNYTITVPAEHRERMMADSADKKDNITKSLEDIYNGVFRDPQKSLINILI